MDLRFDDATLDDVPSLHRWVRTYFEFDGITFDDEAVRRGLRELIGEPSLGRAWLIRVDGKEVGYLIASFGFDLEFGGRQATLTDLFVAPEQRRQGIARRALQYVESVCRALGVRAIELQVETDNVEAQALYASFGFVRHERFAMSKRLVASR